MPSWQDLPPLVRNPNRVNASTAATFGTNWPKRFQVGAPGFWQNPSSH